MDTNRSRREKTPGGVSGLCYDGAMKVIVTGSSGSLGRAVARKFLDEGATVFGTYHRGEPPFQHPAMHWERCDLSQPQEVRELVARVAATGPSSGNIDALVHCAGGFRYARAEETSDADIEFLFESNLKSAFLMARELLPVMRRQNSGRLVFVGSAAAANPPAGMSAYCAFKAGLEAFVASLTEETKGTKITANTVLPSIIDTPDNRSAMPGADTASWVTPQQLAEIISSLTAKWGEPVRGAAIRITGGL